MRICCRHLESLRFVRASRLIQDLNLLAGECLQNDLDLAKLLTLAEEDEAERLEEELREERAVSQSVSYFGAL